MFLQLALSLYVSEGKNAEEKKKNLVLEQTLKPVAAGEVLQ